MNISTSTSHGLYCHKCPNQRHWRYHLDAGCKPMTSAWHSKCGTIKSIIQIQIVQSAVAFEFNARCMYLAHVFWFKIVRTVWGAKHSAPHYEPISKHLLRSIPFAIEHIISIDVRFHYFSNSWCHVTSLPCNLIEICVCIDSADMALAVHKSQITCRWEMKKTIHWRVDCWFSLPYFRSSFVFLWFTFHGSAEPATQPRNRNVE